jgi:hypothetical protein
MDINSTATVRVFPLAGLVLGTCAAGLITALMGCSFPASRDVIAFDACVARHPQETAVCEGPRQAYEIDPTVFQARADALSPPAGSSYVER